jgi:O-antigen/teichoic acid export membrane protein
VFVHNIFIRVITSLITSLIGFLPTVFIVKIFGVGVLGKIAVYYSIAGTISAFVDVGFEKAYNKFLATEKKSKDIAVFLFLHLSLIVLFIIVFFAVSFWNFRNNQDLDSLLLWLAFVVIVLELVAQFFHATFIGMRDFAFLSILEVTSSVLLFLYSLAVCFLWPDIYLLAVNRAVLPIVTMIGGLFYFYKKGLFRIEMPEKADFKKYFSYSIPIAFSSMAGRLIGYLDKLVLGSLLGDNEVGFYLVAQRCYGFIDKLIKPVTNTMFTEIVHRIANTKSFFHKQFKDLVETLNFTGGLMVIIILFASKPVILLLFGAENLRASFILQFSVLTVIGRLFWRPYSNVIYAIEKHKLICLLEPLTIAAVIGCYYLLIPLKIGESFYLGAVAMPITEFITWVLPIGFLRILILKKQYGNIYMMQIVLKIWLPLAIAGSLAFLSRSIFMLPLAIFAFLVMEYFLRIITIKRFRVLLVPFKQILGD